MQTQEIKPEVSIVLLSLLRQKDTQRCLESLFLHTNVPFEIIVVDMGGSEDILRWLWLGTKQRLLVYLPRVHRIAKAG